MQSCTILKGKGTRSEWIGTVTASVGWYRRRMAEVLACDVWLLVRTATCWQHACTDMQAYMYTLCPLSCTMHSGCGDGCSDHFQITHSECTGEWLHKKTYPNCLRFCITNSAELPETKAKRRRRKKEEKMQENTETGGHLFHSPLSCAWSVYAARIAIFFVCCLA